jgi:hypothetical protein
MPLRARVGLARRTPLRASREKRTGRRDTGPDRTVRELVWERDEGRCVVCGEGVYGKPHSIHHRRNRGSGGSSDPRRNAPSNLVLVCGTGTTGCHGWIGASPEEARDAGWVVSLNSIEDPAKVPMIHAVFSASVLLTDEGTVVPVASWAPLDDGTVMDAETGGAA